MRPKDIFSDEVQQIYNEFLLQGKTHLFYLLYSHYLPEVEAIKNLHNKGVGKRCFIIGNGPSLNEIDLTHLKDEITFGVNGIFMNFDRMGFKPTYYIVEDNFVAEDRAVEINELYGPTKIFGNSLSYCLLPDDRTIYANVIYDYADYKNFPLFSENAAQCMWVGGTVTYLCLQMAYYLGFEEVYLVGIDHNYVIPDNIVRKGTELLSTSDDPNHFNTTYFGKGYRWHDPNLSRMELGYAKAREVFENKGRKVFNATKGGNLEVFKRVEYASLFQI